MPLSTGNVVVTSPFDDAGGTDAGAVYLFNGATGALISTLRGSTASDNVGLNSGGFGGVTALTNGNFVVSSLNWDLDATNTNVGAATFGNGTTGFPGAIAGVSVVSNTNSLVGSRPNDSVSGVVVTALTNGPYVVGNPRWDLNASVTDVGAATWGSGTTGVSGAITNLNSLIGSTMDDRVSSPGVTALTNGNYVVRSSIWTLDATHVNVGAVTFGNGTMGVKGAITSSNSLIGSRTSDSVGGDGVTTLPNGNYLVRSSDWDADATHTDVGAVTFGNGTSGTVGAILTSNSLVGSTTGDSVGIQANGGIFVLTNGNYVVGSGFWSLDATHTQVGAVTWGSGTAGVVGAISSMNSLIGSTSDDFVGSAGVVPLTNGNYIVVSNVWDLDATHTNVGAVTFGNATTGVKGSVTNMNSLVGSTSGDALGFASGLRAIALTNGNYVVSAPLWDLDATHTDVGAVRFGNGTTGVTGALTPANSLVGSTTGDQVGSALTALTNGHYVVRSINWDLDATHTDVGAVTWGNGTTGVTDAVGTGNSLLGSTTSDRIGGGIAALTNGNYVVTSGVWDLDATHTDVGAVTFRNGSATTTGTVTAGNSLVGSKTNDAVGGGGAQALTNGNYIVRSPQWDLDASTLNVGAVTFGDGVNGTTGTVSGANSLIGSTAGDNIGTNAATLFANGNYAVHSGVWDNNLLMNAGAVSFGSGTTGTIGAVNASNSAIGAAANTNLQTVVVDNVNNHFMGRFPAEGGGRVRLGSQTNGFAAATDRIGSKRGNRFLQDVNDSGAWESASDRLQTFGNITDTAITGDWNGDGLDEIGVQRGNQFFLDKSGNGIWGGVAGGDALFTFRNPGDKPVTGDWDGDGTDDIGVQSGNQFFLDANGNGVWDGVAGGDLLRTFGNLGDTPLAGDWDGNGVASIGVQRNNRFFLDANDNGLWNGAAGDEVFVFGNTGDLPLVGDWNGNGTDDIGVKRTNDYLLDVSGNGVWNGMAGGDELHSFGNVTDLPLVGNWRPLGPLMAAGGAALSPDDGDPLTTAALAPIVQQAIALWAQTGLNPAQVQSLESVTFAVADLPGAQLGIASGGTILLDVDAAGHGWFVDPTPADNSEFDPSALPNSAFDVPPSMDLLSAVLHELGHELGLDHDDDIEAMLETLAMGTRRLLN